jgi:hypothetical protein
MLRLSRIPIAGSVFCHRLTPYTASAITTSITTAKCRREAGAIREACQGIRHPANRVLPNECDGDVKLIILGKVPTPTLFAVANVCFLVSNRGCEGLISHRCEGQSRIGALPTSSHNGGVGLKEQGASARVVEFHRVNQCPLEEAFPRKLG